MQESNSSKDLYKRLIIRLILAIFYTGIILGVLPKVIGLLHPFIFAFILAAILNPLVSKINEVISKLSKKSLKTRKIITLVLNLLILSAVSSLFFYLAYRTVKEVISFSWSIQQNWPSIVMKFDSFQEYFAWLVDLLPIQFVEALEGFKVNILQWAHNASKNLLSSTVSATASFITGAGSFFINFMTFFLAMYFLMSDYDLIGDIAKKYSNKNTLQTFNIVKNSIINALGGYFKSQLILALCAFVFMFLSLVIYGQPYAFIIAIFLGLIDLLPMLGTSAVLLPWGIIEFISGDITKGIFLIGIGIAFFLIRKVIEPKVMGSQTGLHPLLALMSTYIGLQFSGVWGAILGPLILMLAISIVKSGIFQNTIFDLKAVFYKISKALDRDEGVEAVDSERF